MTLSINANNNKASGLWEFKLAGEADISNAHLLKKRLEAALAEARQSVTFDFSELKYIDSTGLGVIIGVYGALKKEGLSIKILNPRDNVKKLLRIAGLDKVQA